MSNTRLHLGAKGPGYPLGMREGKVFRGSERRRSKPAAFKI